MSFYPAEWAVPHLEQLQQSGFNRAQIEIAAAQMADVAMGNYHTRWQVQECTACEAFADCRARRALGYGALNSPIMIVGERASVDDARWGQALVGTEGFFLGFLLDQLGIDRSMVYVTNLIKCYKDGYDPGYDEAEMCVLHLAYEIEAVRPAVVITLGHLVPAILFGNENFRLPTPPRTPEERRRYMASNWHRYGNLWVRPTYPLRSVLETTGPRQALAKQTLWCDFRAAVLKAMELRPGYNYRLSRPPVTESEEAQAV